MGGEGVQHFVSRAQDFYDAMDLLRDETQHRSSSALLAIHAAISYADALRIGLGDDQLGAEDHDEAARSLRRLLGRHTIKVDEGVRHLEIVLGRKSTVAYGKKRLTAKEYEVILTHADRFAAWAISTGLSLRMEGWRNGVE